MPGSRFWSVIAGTAVVVIGFNLPAVSAQQRMPAAGRQAAAEGMPMPAGDDAVARGRYIVEDVAVCSRCHSPVNSQGERDPERWLAGGAIGFQSSVAVPQGDWAMVAPRIAGTPPGTDAEFVHLLMTGISRNGRRLRQPMPQFRMSQSDAEAVLAYLKSLR